MEDSARAMLQMQVMLRVIQGEETSVIPSPRPSCLGLSGARAGPKSAQGGEVQGVSSGAPTLLARACSSRALLRGHATKWCVSVLVVVGIIVWGKP